MVAGHFTPTSELQSLDPVSRTVASGLVIGLFFSMVPMIPQSIVAAILAMRVKANVPFAMEACFISNPFTNVPFWIAQIRLGQWLIDVSGVSGWGQSKRIHKFLSYC